MNENDNARIFELCSLITVEQDREKFLDLVKELNRILEAQEERLHDDRKPYSSPGG